MPYNPDMPLTSTLLLTIAFQQAVTADVTAARNLSKAAQAYAEKNQARKKMYMLKGGKTWVLMKKDSDHLKDEMWREDISMVAFTWAQNGKLQTLSITGGSPSGDWSSHKLSTYRPDGTLVRSVFHYSAFMLGGRVLEEESVFNRQGKKTFSRMELMDLDGKKLKNASEQKQVLGFRPTVKDYLKVSQLPFPK